MTRTSETRRRGMRKDKGRRVKEAGGGAAGDGEVTRKQREGKKGKHKGKSQRIGSRRRRRNAVARNRRKGRRMSRRTLWRKKQKNY